MEKEIELFEKSLNKKINKAFFEVSYEEYIG